MENFNELSLPKPLLEALAALNFERPTPIQSQSLPMAMEGRDLIACAQTGSGKTAAFVLPMLVRLLQDPQMNGLVLVPTRELAKQVNDVVAQLTRFTHGMRTLSLIGGESMGRQMQGLARRPRIVVATPGRLMDHLERRSISLSRVGVLVLDEADRMLDMGFAPQLDRIRADLPEERQTLLFSATMPPNIRKLAQQYLQNPVQVQIQTSPESAPKITQSTRETSSADKYNVLLDELQKREGSVLIFARTKSRTDRLAQQLGRQGVTVARIHGDRSQGQRNHALQDFRSGAVRVLVATDVAARGIDIDHVAHVINFDLPEVAEDYVHRIGRTGRAGREGQALSLITPEEMPMWLAISRFLQGKPVGRMPSPHRRVGQGGGRPPRGGGGGGGARRFGARPGQGGGRPQQGGRFKSERRPFGEGRPQGQRSQQNGASRPQSERSQQQQRPASARPAPHASRPKGPASGNHAPRPSANSRFRPRSAK